MSLDPAKKSACLGNGLLRDEFQPVPVAQCLEFLPRTNAQGRADLPRNDNLILGRHRNGFHSTLLRIDPEIVARTLPASIAERLQAADAPKGEFTASAAEVAGGDGAIPETDDTPPAVAVETAGNGTARPADASASAAAEPRPTHPLESHLNALPRAPLMPFDATGRMAAAIPFAFDDYLELVDTTGRVICEDKRGCIPGETPQILERLNIDPEQFITTAARMLDLFGTAIGTPEHLTAHCVARNVAFLRGMGAARALFERKAA
jgi:hypothetical protein